VLAKQIVQNEWYSLKISPLNRKDAVLHLSIGNAKSFA
jgi:hypothetical protein